LPLDRYLTHNQARKGSTILHSSSGVFFWWVADAVFSMTAARRAGSIPAPQHRPSSTSTFHGGLQI